MKNNYQVEGSRVLIELKRRKKDSLWTSISIVDFDKANSIVGSWVSQWDKTIQGYYVICNIVNAEGKHSTKRLHTFLMDPPDGYQVDHFNHDTLNNERDNLRVVTNAENSQNRRTYSNSKSGIRGVGFHRGRGMWRARATINYVQHNLGYFLTKELAENAVVEFRAKNMNFSKEANEYGIVR